VTALVGYSFPKPLVTCYGFYNKKKIATYKTNPKFFFFPLQSHSESECIFQRFILFVFYCSYGNE